MHESLFAGGDSESSPARSASAPVAEGDEFWWDGFALPELDGRVECVVEFRGSLVIGGRFTRVGGVAARNIASWDGSGWSPLGDGFDGEVLSLALFRGELVASGRFDHGGGEPLRGIARWNGRDWSSLGGGLWLENILPSPGARALATKGNLLYAAGDFDRAGGAEASHVACWNGDAWSALGDGVDAPAQSLLVSGNSLYVGGFFATAGGAPASGVALWDGQSWLGLNQGVSSSSGYFYVDDMVAYRGSIVVAGLFDSAGGVPARNLAAWDGESWSVVGTPLINGSDYGGNALAAVGDTLVIGSFGLRSWNGSDWIESLGVYGWVSCLLQTPAGLVVGGQFAAYARERMAAKSIGIVRDGYWNDLTTWTDRMHGLDRLGSHVEVSALASYRGVVVAAGSFDHAGGPTGRVPLAPIAYWDGGAWSSLGTPPTGITRCFLAADGELYAGGMFQSQSSPGVVPVSRFDGSRWTQLDTLSMQTMGLATYGGSLYAVGRRLSLGHPKAGGIYRWSGNRWDDAGPIDGADDFPAITSVLGHQGRLVVGGLFHSIAGVPAVSLAAWDGHSWAAMDAGILSARVVSLGECDGVLYAGGEFRDSAGEYANLLRWDGSRWIRVPGPRMEVLAFASANHRLFAGGWLSDATGTQRGIMSWDGRGWTSLGSGTNDMVGALLVHDGQLYVGGRFSQAGTGSSSGIARWDLRREQRASTMLRSEAGVPNPFRVSTSIAYRLAMPGHVRVAVFDLRGRRIAVIENAKRTAGTHTATWDGHTEDGRTAPSGVYFLRLDLPGGSESRRVVRLQ